MLGGPRAQGATRGGAGWPQAVARPVVCNVNVLQGVPGASTTVAIVAITWLLFQLDALTSTLIIAFTWRVALNAQLAPSVRATSAHRAFALALNGTPRTSGPAFERARALMQAV